MRGSIRIEECRANHENYVLVMAGMSDRELAKRLDLVHIQMEIAEKTKNISSLELLEVWRQQIIEARILKAENQIPDQPSEIELAIADIETVVAKSEERESLLRERHIEPQIDLKSETNKSKHPDEDQLRLF